MRSSTLASLVATATVAVLIPFAPPAGAAVSPDSRTGLGVSGLPPGAHRLHVGANRLPDTVIDGKPVPVWVQVSPVRLLPRAAQGTTACWTAYHTVYYGPWWYRQMRFRQQVSWCGNGRTISSHGQFFSEHIYATGIPGAWRWLGMTDTPSQVMFYNNWAWQMYGQGQFAQCPLYGLECYNFKSPWLAYNVYADGRLDGFGGA